MIIHKPVLLQETIEALNLKKGSTVVDATLGGGGYARKILEAIGEKGRFIGIDLDQETIDKFSKVDIFSRPKNEARLQRYTQHCGQVILVRDNFAHLEDILKKLGINSVDAIVADLGLSSDQLQDKSRGFSFLGEGNLDMRYSLRNIPPERDPAEAVANPYEYTNIDLTAEKIVNTYSEKELAKIISKYGEEKFARNIARKIIIERKKKPITTTFDLVKVINAATPGKYKYGKINPATRTFQALRIEVNNELDNLERFIPQAIKFLKPKGRLAIISFHSLEDRIVKNIFRENARGCICPKEFPICQCGEKPKVKIITKKPIASTLEEIEDNPRARSAKLRICEKI